MTDIDFAAIGPLLEAMTLDELRALGGVDGLAALTRIAHQMQDQRDAGEDAEPLGGPGA